MAVPDTEVHSEYTGSQVKLDVPIGTPRSLSNDVHNYQPTMNLSIGEGSEKTTRDKTLSSEYC